MTESPVKLSTRLGLSFFAMTALVMVLGAAALVEMSRMGIAAEDLATNWLPSIKSLGVLRYEANRVRRGEAEVILATDAAEFKVAMSRLEERKHSLEDAQRVYEPLISEDEERKGYEVYKQHRGAYFEAQARAIALAQSGDKGSEGGRAVFRGDSLKAFEAMGC